MKKLLNGVLDYKNYSRLKYDDLYEKLAGGQSPETLMISCSDSRVMPTLFTSSDPGELFTVRCVGNIVPKSTAVGHAEGSAIEFAIRHLKVKQVVVCGHSGCGAMGGLLAPEAIESLPYVKSWLEHAHDSLDALAAYDGDRGNLDEVNLLSQLNVLQQLKHLETYDCVKEGVEGGTLTLGGWWFDIGVGMPLVYDAGVGKFVDVHDGMV